MWGLIKRGSQVGGRQHKEKDNVAQTGWDGILGKAHVGPLLPPLRCSVGCTPLGRGTSRQHSSRLPSPHPPTWPFLTTWQSSLQGASLPLAGAMPWLMNIPVPVLWTQIFISMGKHLGLELLGHKAGVYSASSFQRLSGDF